MNFYLVCGEMAEALLKTGKNFSEKKKAIAIWQFLINKVTCLKFYSCCEAQPASDCDRERNQNLHLKFVGK